MQTNTEKNRIKKEKLIEKLGRVEYQRRYNHRSNVKKRIFKNRTHGFCVKCKQRYPRNELTLDHIVPLRDGGTHEKSNLQILCRPCHDVKDFSRKKTENKPFEDLKKLLTPNT